MQQQAFVSFNEIEKVFKKKPHYGQLIYSTRLGYEANVLFEL